MRFFQKSGKAAVTILFNYNTDEEKEWFDGIRKLELVEYNEQKNQSIRVSYLTVKRMWRTDRDALDS